MGCNILLNIPLDDDITYDLEKYIYETKEHRDIFINTRMFEGHEEKYIMREIASMMPYITKCRTFRINGKLSDIQRRIAYLANDLEIDNEFIDIDINGEHSWLNIT